MADIREPKNDILASSSPCDEDDDDDDDEVRDTPPLTILHAGDESVEVNMAKNASAVEAFFQMLKDKEMELMYQKRQLENCLEEVQFLRQRLKMETDPAEREKLIQMSENIAIAFIGKKVVFREQYEQWRGGMVQIGQEFQRHGLAVKIPVKYRNDQQQEEEADEEEAYDDEEDDDSESYSEETTTEDASVE